MYLRLIAVSIFSILGAVSCVQYHNSSSLDPERYRPELQIDTSTPAGQRFSAASKIMNKRCSECHTFTSYSTEAQFKADSLYQVVPGNLAASPIYSRLRGANVGGNGDMPENGSLNNTELSQMRDWILNMTP